MAGYALTGGLDLRTNRMQVSPGTLQDCLNYDVEGDEGYHRIAGLEPYDGQFHVAEFRTARLTVTGSATPKAGDDVTWTDGSGVVTKVDGALAYVIMHARTTWPITLPADFTVASGTMSATDQIVLPEAVGLASDVKAARKALATTARALVKPVPGDPTKPVCGEFWFNDRLYAIRDFPVVWFSAIGGHPFNAGDDIIAPGGTFTAVDVVYLATKYSFGYLVLHPVDGAGIAMQSLPKAGDILSHASTGSGFVLGSVPIASVPLGENVDISASSSSATVVASQEPANTTGDVPALKSATASAGLWKAETTGWESVDLKRQVQFVDGSTTMQTFLDDHIGAGADPITSAAKPGTNATLNGTDCTDDVNADDGTSVSLGTAARNELRVLGLDFSLIPDSATILGVQVLIKRQSDASDPVHDGTVQLLGLDGGSSNKAGQSDWPVSADTATYGSANDLWGNSNITTAVVKASTFGVRLVAQADGNTSSGSIDYVAVKVTYRRRDAQLYAHANGGDVPFMLLNATVAGGSYATSDASGSLMVDFTTQSFTPSIPSGAQVRTAPLGAGDLLCDAASSDSIVTLPGYSDLLANKSLYQFVATNFKGEAEYAAVYGVSGASHAFVYDGRYFSWIRTTIDAVLDLPRHIARHANSLVLGYYQGAYLLSAPGAPSDFSAVDDAVSNEVGERLTNLMDAMGTALLITTPTRTMILQGTDSGSYSQSTISGNRGAVEYSNADAGRLVVADQLGIAAADATQVFGDLTRTYLSEQVQRWLSPRMTATNGKTGFIAALAVRTKNQYRMYFQDGYVLTMTVKQPVEFTLQRYYKPGKQPEDDTPFAVTCVADGVDANLVERAFAAFQSGDLLGYVCEMDHGFTFNGSAIPAHITLNPLTFGDDTVLKHYDRIFVDGMVDGYSDTTLDRAADTDALDGTGTTDLLVGDESNNVGTAHARGETDAPIDGFSLSLKIESSADDDSGHTLQAISAIASKRGVSRGATRA